jgi:zinc D-Ala-D-Ala carboxypeptidase
MLPTVEDLKKGTVKDWSVYAPYFKESEFVCSHTGLCYMQESFMRKLLIARLIYNAPMTISSGYRHPTHPIEARKKQAGYHSHGIAADIACWSDQAYDITKIAYQLEFRGIGTSQSPSRSARFIHLDDRPIQDVARSYSY